MTSLEKSLNKNLFKFLDSQTKLETARHDKLSNDSCLLKESLSKNKKEFLDSWQLYKSESIIPKFSYNIETSHNAKKKRELLKQASIETYNSIYGTDRSDIKKYYRGDRGIDFSNNEVLEDLLVMSTEESKITPEILKKLDNGITMGTIPDKLAKLIEEKKKPRSSSYFSIGRKDQKYAFRDSPSSSNLLKFSLNPFTSLSKASYSRSFDDDNHEVEQYDMYDLNRVKVDKFDTKFRKGVDSVGYKFKAVPDKVLKNLQSRLLEKLPTDIEPTSKDILKLYAPYTKLETNPTNLRESESGMKSRNIGKNNREVNMEQSKDELKYEYKIKDTSSSLIGKSIARKGFGVSFKSAVIPMDNIAKSEELFNLYKEYLKTLRYCDHLNKENSSLVELHQCLKTLREMSNQLKNGTITENLKVKPKSYSQMIRNRGLEEITEGPHKSSDIESEVNDQSLSTKESTNSIKQHNTLIMDSLLSDLSVIPNYLRKEHMLTKSNLQSSEKNGLAEIGIDQDNICLNNTSELLQKVGVSREEWISSEALRRALIKYREVEEALNNFQTSSIIGTHGKIEAHKRIAEYQKARSDVDSEIKKLRLRGGIR
ncbi:uncharacterized protein CMU_033220 [Cryptosporidium muris RN66]|uniref:Uncharacterized protein n=1 Tax=Cryptosporidium muris (strain RN66) TaxID=441375 RepID=B6AFE6_CRYMR|nr:uncharacterized protein CMU_033220 [Cryptosporidium muris RN66]EEA06937.1 hypothetical protein CMU_033220 [Cryptosporidium muris RN66]|eukprot:XP_002141286.1 hypothetical protein [Cryptosporidium muris RN66]